VVAIDVNHAITRAALCAETQVDMYHDENAVNSTLHLHALLGGIPMFASELPMAEAAMSDYGNKIDKNPTVHPEIAGRGIEYAHGRAAFYYKSRCKGKLAEMKELCYGAYSIKNIPEELMAKYERRTNDYQRAYRMGVLTKDLEKMRKEIKTHRNMIDFHQNFIK
jgi:hypothetical protein